MPVKRPCIVRAPDGRGCPEYALPGKSRCEAHEHEFLGERWEQGRTGKRGSRAGWRKLRLLIWERQGKRCKRCGTRPRKFFVHHKDGDAMNDHPSNLEGLCEACHERADAEVRALKRSGHNPR